MLWQRPKIVAAKLNYYSPLGEGGPAAVGAAFTNNDGADLYGEAAQYRLRLYTSAGFSPDGIASLLPGILVSISFWKPKAAMGLLFRSPRQARATPLGKMDH